MTKEDSAKVMAVKYVLDYNTFKRNSRLNEDLIAILALYKDDKEYDALFERYCTELRESKREKPLWARLIMAERYSLNI